MGLLSRRAFLRAVVVGAVGAMTGRVVDSRPKKRLVTVTGEIGVESAGVVLPHEHVMVDFTGAMQIRRDRYDADEVHAKVIAHLVRARGLGCQTLVECTPAWLGRDVTLLKRLSESSGLNIITCTGFYGAVGDKYLPPFALRESAEQLAERWTNEWRHGINGTGIRPGFIKTGVDPDPSEVDMKLVRAAGLAHLATGLVIASHTGPGPAARKQIETLARMGVSPSAFVWVHAHVESDVSAHEWAARQGAWVEFDGISPGSVDHHAELVAEMRKRGLLDRVLVSHDAGWYEVGRPGGGEFRPYDTLFTQFVPALRHRGFTEDEIKLVIRVNPAEAFCVREPSI